MRLLHRQELIHQLELEKWHDLIGAATELLRQVSRSNFLSLATISRILFTLLTHDFNGRESLINNWMGREDLGPGGIWGRVQGVGSDH